MTRTIGRGRIWGQNPRKRNLFSQGLAISSSSRHDPHYSFLVFFALALLRYSIGTGTKAFRAVLQCTLSNIHVTCKCAAATEQCGLIHFHRPEANYPRISTSVTAVIFAPPFIVPVQPNFLRLSMYIPIVNRYPAFTQRVTQSRAILYIFVDDIYRYSFSFSSELRSFDKALTYVNRFNILQYHTLSSQQQLTAILTKRRSKSDCSTESAGPHSQLAPFNIDVLESMLMGWLPRSR